jgi:hypothetical protein
MLCCVEFNEQKCIGKAEKEEVFVCVFRQLVRR